MYAHTLVAVALLSQTIQTFPRSTAAAPPLTVGRPSTRLKLVRSVVEARGRATRNTRSALISGEGH